MFFPIKVINSPLQLSQGSLCAARRAAAFVRGDDVIHKLFTELAYRYKWIPNLLLFQSFFFLK